MDFSQNTPIYIQIVRRVEDGILTGELLECGRIPSVRELAGELQVNPNTMMRAYEELARQGIVANKRGLGYFVLEGATARIRSARRADFFDRELPRMFAAMRTLGIGIEEVAGRWK